MRTSSFKALLALVLFSYAAQLRAQTYSVDWFKVAGGGGTSTGSVYAVNGTFGQQDAGGPMAGGSYSVEGGFWSPLDLQSSIVTGSAPVITTQPQSLNYPGGGAASFSVSVSGTPPFYYQWQINGINLTDGGDLSGSITSNLVWSATVPADGGTNSYQVIVDNAYGSVTSSAALLIAYPPAIISQPQNLILSNGNPARFSVSVSGTPPLSFQWQKDGANLTGGGNISSHVTASGIGNGNNFYVCAGAVGSNDGSDWSNAWTDVTRINWGSVSPGDSIWIAGGNYGTLLIGASGATNSPIYIARVRSTNSIPTSAAGWNAAYDSQVVLSSYENYGSYNCITLDGQVPYSGILITNTSLDGVNLMDYAASSVNYSVTKNCDIGGACTESTVETGETRCFNCNSIGIGNYFGYCQFHNAPTLFSTLYQVNFVVEHCKFYSNLTGNTATNHPNVWQTVGCTNVTVRYCEFYNWQAEGIMMDFVDTNDELNVNWYLYGNVWHDPIGGLNGGSARIIESQYNPNGPVYMFNNTFVGIYIGVDLANGGSWNSANASANNIYFQTGDSHGFGQGNDDYDLSDAANSEPHGIGGASSNIFVNFAAQNYQIVSNIDAAYPRNNGATLPTRYGIDFNDNLRGADGAWDIGAFEYNPGISNTAPPIVCPMFPVIEATASLALSTTATNDTGDYSVIITNPWGSVTSSVARLTLILPAYFVTDIGSLNDTTNFTCANAINNSEQVVGKSATGNGYSHAFLYNSGTMQDLGTLGGNFSTAYCINNSGQVVGYSEVPGNSPVNSFLYSGGTMTNLDNDSYNYNYAYAINDNGEIVGSCSFYGLLSFIGAFAFLDADGTPTGLALNFTNLGTLGGLVSTAYGINNSGQVVGEAGMLNGHSHAFLYSSGTMQDLGTLGGDFSAAYGINSSGQVVGKAGTLNGYSHAFLYGSGTMQDLGTLGGNSSAAYGINSSGQVVGCAAAGSGSHAFLYSGGKMFDLNNLVNTNTLGTVLNVSKGINDYGQLIANGTNGHAYILTPSLPASYLTGNFPPQLQTIVISGGNFQFSWNVVNTYPAVGYQVQYTTNLVTPDWTNLGGVLFGSDTIIATDALGPDQQRFYRVLLVQ